MKIKVKDGKGKRIVTEIKRPEPQAILVFKEEEEFEVSNEELHTLIELEYVHLRDVNIVGTAAPLKAVYPDAVVFHEEAKMVAKPAPEAPKVIPKVEPKKV